MKTITQFDTSNLETVEKALEKSVQAVAKRFGLEIKSWGCNYDSTQSTFKLRATIPGAAEAKGAAEFKKYAGKATNSGYLNHGLPASALGKQLKDNRHTYTIIGYEPYKKFSIQTTREDGASISMTPEYAQRLLCQ